MISSSTNNKRVPLFYDGILSAIRDGNLQKVKTRLDDRFINFENFSYMFLCEALKARQKDVAKFLISKGADVNAGKCSEGSTVALARKKGAYRAETTPLHLAVRLGDEEITELLLQKGAWTEKVAGHWLGTPLCDAVRFYRVRVAEILINHGASLNTPDVDGKTPLTIAAGKSVASTKLLLDHGADPSSGLPGAAETGKVEVVKLLLSRGANLKVKSGVAKSTLLQVAAENRHGQLVDFLLKRGADVDAVDIYNKSVLTTAVKTCCPVMVSIVLSHYPDVKKKSNKNAVQSAIRCQSRTEFSHEQHAYAEIIQHLLSYGFTIDDQDATDPKALFVAVRNGYVKIVTELITRGSNLKMLRNSILSELLPLYPSTLSNIAKLAYILTNYCADENARCTMGLMPSKSSLFRNMDFDLFKLLLTDRAVVKDDRDLLKYAVWHGYLEITNCLLRHGADVNVRDSSGRAALHFCVLRPKNPLCPISQRTRSSIRVNNKIMKMLVLSGADLNIRTELGETPLHLAARNNLIETVEVLVELGADVNAADDQGWTALHHFARNGNLESSEYLLSKGAMLNTESKGGLTALHVASERGQLDVVQSLLEHGANVDSNSASRGTALHIACLEGRSDVVRFLVEYGADINVKNRCDDIAICVLRCSPPFRESLLFIMPFLVRHLFKMKAANMFLSEKNLELMKSDIQEEILSMWMILEPNSFPVPDNFLKECEDEVAAIKHTKLQNSNVSCYDVLAASSSRLVKLSANESVRDIVNSQGFDRRFPLYASMIKRRYQRGKWMRTLWEKCAEALQGILPQLPYLCIERILAHIPVSDMQRMTVVSQSTDHSKGAFTLGSFASRSCRKVPSHPVRSCPTVRPVLPRSPRWHPTARPVLPRSPRSHPTARPVLPQSPRSHPKVQPVLPSSPRSHPTVQPVLSSSPRSHPTVRPVLPSSPRSHPTVRPVLPQPL